MDSEGLRSPELAGSFRHDNEIATLVACLANTTIVNFWGQTFSKEMADIMQIIAHAYIRMKEVDIKSSFHLIFAGVQDVTAEEKNKLGVSRVMDELNEMILKVAKNESHKENLNALSSIFPLLSEKLNAKIPEFLPNLWLGPMSPPESRYGEITDQIRNSLCRGLTIDNSTAIQSQPLKEFSDRLCSVWNAIKIENFIFGFKNTKAIETFAELQNFYDQEIGKVISGFFQLSWKIGEETLQKAHQSKDEHQSFQEYCTKIDKKMSPKIALMQDKFDEKFRTFVTQLSDPETASNHMNAFSIDLAHKMQGWRDNERKEIQYKISTICKKEKTAPMKRNEYRKNFVTKARELAQELKGGSSVSRLDQGAINDAFTGIFTDFLDKAQIDEIGMTENIKNLFSKIWEESKEHLIVKLKTFLPKSNAALDSDIEECFKLVKCIDIEDDALFDIPFNPSKQLKHKIYLTGYAFKEVTDLSYHQLELIKFKLKDEIEKCGEGSASYFNCSASIARILEEVHYNLTSADLHGWKYDSSLMKDFLIRSFGILVNKMAILEKENLMKYSLVALLHSERQILFEEFKKECQTANDDVLASKRFIDDTISSILVSQVKVSVGFQVFDAILATEKFNQKNSMMFFLLKELLDSPFEKLVSYINNYENFMQKWFQRELIDFCNKEQFLLCSIKQKNLAAIAELKTILRSFAETKVSQIKEKSVWWLNLKALLDQNGFVYQVNMYLLLYFSSL